MATRFTESTFRDIQSIILPPIYNDKISGLCRSALTIARRPSGLARPAEIKIRVRPDPLDVDADSLGDVLSNPVGNGSPRDNLIDKLLRHTQFAGEFGLRYFCPQEGDPDFHWFHVLRFGHYFAPF